jgi:hypothetical protein
LEFMHMLSNPSATRGCDFAGLRFQARQRPTPHMVLGVDVLLAALHARQEHAGLKARGAEHGLLRDGDAFEREELLRVGGPVSGDEIVLETGDFFPGLRN